MVFSSEFGVCHVNPLKFPFVTFHWFSTPAYVCYIIVLIFPRDKSLVNFIWKTPLGRGKVLLDLELNSKPRSVRKWIIWFYDCTILMPVWENLGSQFFMSREVNVPTKDLVLSLFISLPNKWGIWNESDETKIDKQQLVWGN